MKNITGILALLILSACSANKFDVQLVVNLPPSVDKVLAFAIVDFNPTEKFVKAFDAKDLTAVPATGGNEADKNAQISAPLTTNWDALFNGLPATDNFMMNSRDSVNYSKTGGIFVPLSNHWWVMSKAFMIDGKPYCYVVQLDIKKGSEISCKPDQSNLVSLIEVYQNQIVNKP